MARAAKYYREYYAKNSEKRREYQKAWVLKNIERVKEQRRLRAIKNRASNKARHRLWVLQNPERQRTRTANWRAKNPDKVNAAALRRKYGITPEALQRLFDTQGSACALCKKHSSESKLHIDHDHLTGKVRGLLCRTCNNRLGYYETTPPGWLQAVGNYLQEAV
jgi:hypothetical protein